MIELRKMEMTDIPAGLSFCRSYRWNQLARDWEIFLKLDPDSSIVACEGSEVAGTLTTMCHGTSLAWIGMVLVDPEKQGRGIARQLLNEALSMLGDVETIKLDATPEGKKVYSKLGFRGSNELSRMEATVQIEIPQNINTRKIRQTDLPALLAIDKEIFGEERGQLLQWLFDGAPEFAFMTETNGGIGGFCFGRKGARFSQVGPIIASAPETAIQLLSAALGACKGSPVVIDVLHYDEQWMAFLGSLGFRLQRSLTRMILGPDRFPGIPAKQFAIAGPEYG
jgi:ribosomal protein S18 acetylase RimI-like enzyme